MPSNNNTLEKRLWEGADDLRANSRLRASQYSMPVLGLIFLRFADYKFSQAEKELLGQAGGTGRRKIDKTTYQARGVMYLPDIARYGYLLKLAENENIGKAINEAMKAIEDENEDLRGVLPKQYTSFENDLLVSLLRTFNFQLDGLEGDVFGKIYEYFLGKFAASEGQKGGEYYTPISLVKLIVEVIEPYHGYILDPACGSGGMFVQSAEFVRRHNANPMQQISIYGQEKETLSVRLAKMNLAVHGLNGIIREGNTYYEDIHRSIGKFDFVMANPPFNVDKVDKTKLKTDPRFPLGLPTMDNANYLWIQIFHSALNETGRAGFVMASSASDARGSEQMIRRKLIESKVVDVMIAISSNFFYTVTLPCTLWFLDKSKNGKPRENTVLFIDARNIYHQADRVHRDFSLGQLEFLANIVNLYRGEQTENVDGSDALLAAHFPDGLYRDVLGLCKVATIEEIASQGYSLNPGRYVGYVAHQQLDDFDFKVRLEELSEELESLNAEAHELEEKITINMHILSGD